MDFNSKEFLWTEKYRPEKIEDCILPSETKKIFSNFLKNRELQHLLLAGTSGIGKTTIAKILCEQMNCDYLLINGSNEGRLLETIRGNIMNFASTVSMMHEGFKVVIIDEADNMFHDVQPALRGVFEEFSANCRFILTCNYSNKIIPAIKSRCTTINFNIPRSERQELAKQFLVRIQQIAKNEKISVDMDSVSKLVVKNFPDFRRTLNELQKYSSDGKIDASILDSTGKIEVLQKAIKEKDFPVMRKWVAENSDNDPVTIMRNIYDTGKEIFEAEQIPEVVLIIAKYLDMATRCPDQEINLAACCTELMTV